MVPQFRTFPPQPIRGSDGTISTIPQPPVTLEFSALAHLPAILAAPSPNGRQAGAAQVAAETRILEDFIYTTQLPHPNDTTGNGISETGASEVQDARWDVAARIADEETRVFLGHDGFMQKSLEAALLRLQTNRIPP